MKESLSIRFLYGTVPGRVLLKAMVAPPVSKVGGKVLSTGLSKKAVPGFIKKHNIDMEGVDVPEKGFRSFNDFFTRVRMPEQTAEPGKLYSPCDGFLTVLDIQRGMVMDIKNSRYSLEDLLGDEALAEKYEGGKAYIFRLTPANYHRYSFPCDGVITDKRTIGGKLHCVRPLALRTLPVFVQNAREYVVYDTDSFGTIVQMEVGALMVGKISNHPVKRGDRVAALKEKGYFEFGGSTIILLVEKGAHEFDEKLLERLDENGEMPVRLGEEI